MVHRIMLGLFLCVWSIAATAQDKQFSLSAPDELVDTGFLKHLLPRFSLKTGIRIVVNGPDPQVVLPTDTGIPVFQGPKTVWRLEATDAKFPQRFRDWLTSDVGLRTITAFKPDGTVLFGPPTEEVQVVEAVAIEGDAVEGERLSLSLCGRCHVISEKNRMNGMGSTPSFAVLRTLSNWENRFEAFYALKPHGAFTQVEDVTPPFDPLRPSPIVPVEMTLDDLDAILAYVWTIKPADLGAPIQSQ